MVGLVHRLEDQLDVELGGRPIEPRQRLNERGQHVRLAIERHEDGVGGKRRIRRAARARRLEVRVPAQELVSGRGTQADHRHEQHGEQQRDCADDVDRRQQKGAEEARADGDQSSALPQHRPRARALLRPADGQPLDRGLGESGREVGWLTASRTARGVASVKS